MINNRVDGEIWAYPAELAGEIPIDDVDNNWRTT